jgi:FkbM family methyltransferase
MKLTKMIKNIIIDILNLYPIKFIRKTIKERFVFINDKIAKKGVWLFVRIDSFMENDIIKKGLYEGWEKESLKIWSFLSQKYDTIIDIGANTGIYSLLAKNNNSNSKVIALEPIDINYNILVQNIKRNNFTIIADKIAISDKDGLAKMFMLKDTLNYMTSINDNRYSKHPEITGKKEIIEVEIRTKTFDYIFEKYELKSLDLIKIDVEGHEVTIIQNMIPFIERFKPVILLEIISDENAKILNDIFNKYDYLFISIDEKNISKRVSKLWDNDHHNFLLCNTSVYDYLKHYNLVE